MAEIANNDISGSSFNGAEVGFLEEGEMGFRDRVSLVGDLQKFVRKLSPFLFFVPFSTDG